MSVSCLPSESQRVVDILHVRSCREHGRCGLWLLWAPSAASKVLWETRFVRRSSRRRAYRARFPQHRQDPQAARTWQGCRSCRRRDRPCPSRCRRCRSRGHVVFFGRLAGASCVRRIEWPLSSMRCASWSKRSQIASAWLGSPMTACQSVTGQLTGNEHRSAFGAVLDPPR